MELDDEKIKALENFCRREICIDTILNLEDKKERTEYYDKLSKSMVMYSKQEENSDESIFYKEQFKELSEDLNDGFGPYINEKVEHEKILLKLNEEIKTYGLKKLIVKVNEGFFFSRIPYAEKNYPKDIFTIEELDLVPRLLKLGYLDNVSFRIYMVRDEDYKNLFRFGMFDYSYHYVDVPHFYKVCSYLYPDRVPKISENLFEEFIKYAKESEKRLSEWFHKINKINY